LSNLFFEDLREVVDNEVVALVTVGAQKDACLFEVFTLKGFAGSVRKEDSVIDGCEGAAHDAVDDPVPLGVHHLGRIHLTQARGHVAHLVL